MNTLKILPLLFVAILLTGKSAEAQNSHYLFSGYTSAGFESIDGDHSFVIGNFAPVFLYSHGDRFLVETELKIGYGHDGVSTDLEYLNLGYILNDYVTVRAGQFLSRFNTYNDRFHAAWINKMPNDPLGLGHHDLLGLPSEFGVELSGGAYLGGPKINYALFVSNGLAMEVDDHGPTVNFDFTNFSNHNNSYAVGGRFGFLPLDDSSLEIGIGGHYNNKIGDPHTDFEDVSSLSWSADLSYLRQNISWLSGNIDLRAQINSMSIDRFDIPGDNGNGVHGVNLDQHAYYGQLAYRPTRSRSELLSDLEFVLRYSVHDLPVAQFEEDDDHAHSIQPAPDYTNEISINRTLQYKVMNPPSLLNGGDAHNDEVHNGITDTEQQWGFGVNYWISWRTKVKFSYQINEYNGHSGNAFIIQFATGL